MRIRTSLALAAVVATTLWMPVAQGSHLPGPCNLHRRAGEPIGHYSKRQITCAVEELGPVPGGTERAICIADRESGLDPKASSPTGQYLGLYQHAAEAWPTRFEANTDPAWGLGGSALNGRSNAIVTIVMVADAGRWKAAGWPRGEC